MSESNKLELITSQDYERLRSLGYNRLALFEYYAVPAVANSTLLTTATYGAGITVSADFTDLDICMMIADALKCVATYLINIRDGTAATRWDIDNDIVNLGGLIEFASEAAKGYNRQKASATLGASGDGWLLETATGALTALTAGRANRTHASETGSEDWVRLWGYYWGLFMDPIMGSHNVAAHGTAAKRMFRFEAAKGLMILATVFIIGIIQSEIAKINIGRKIGTLPAEYDILSIEDVPDEWRYIFEGIFPSTNNTATTAEAPLNLANYIGMNFSYLPQTALINILRQRLKVWKIPRASLDIARTMFGLAHSEFDYPTNFGVLLNVGDEQDTDKKYVGYGLLYAIQMLDEFFGPARTNATYNLSELFEQVLASEHWTYKGFRERNKDVFTNFSLSTLKGQMEPSFFTPVKAHFRTEDATITRGHWANGRDHQETDPLIMMAVTAPDGVTGLFARGGWTLEQIGAFLRYQLLFGDGPPGVAGGNALLDRQALLMGEQYYTRMDKVLNYVAPDNTGINVRIGANLAYDGTMFDQLGLSLEDLTQDWSGLITVSPSRLPVKKFPMPVVIEEIYNLDKVTAMAKVILSPVGSATPASTTVTNENTNANKDTSATEEDD